MQMQNTVRGSFNGAALRSKAFMPLPVQRGSLQVAAAVSRTRKAEIVTELKEKLDGSLVVFGMRFKGLNVPKIQKFRKSLPESTSVFVCKNNLMKVAVAEKADWSSLADKGCKGENAWVFVPEADLQDTLKAYYKFEEDLFTDAKKVAPKNTEVKRPTEVSVVVMDGKYLSPAELKKVESLPTKKQLLATIAGLAKQPATKIATGVKAVPTKLARALMLVADLSEDKSVTVASVMKA